MSSPARMCISVDLPEPDGPMTAVSAPRRDRDRDATQRVDRGVALRRTAASVLRDDDRCSVSALHVRLPDRFPSQTLPERRTRTAPVRLTVPFGQRRCYRPRVHRALAASPSTSPRMPTISSSSASPATSGGEIWTTGSPRSSWRQIRPASKSAGERKPRSSDSHSASSNVCLRLAILDELDPVEEARAADVADDRDLEQRLELRPERSPRWRERAR